MELLASVATEGTHLQIYAIFFLCSQSNCNKMSYLRILLAAKNIAENQIKLSVINQKIYLELYFLASTIILFSTCVKQPLTSRYKRNLFSKFDLFSVNKFWIFQMYLSVKTTCYIDCAKIQVMLFKCWHNVYVMWYVFIPWLDDHYA